MRIKTAQQALDLVRRHDAAKLVESLEPWQRQELACIVRRIVAELDAEGRAPTLQER